MYRSSSVNVTQVPFFFVNTALRNVTNVQEIQRSWTGIPAPDRGVCVCTSHEMQGFDGWLHNYLGRKGQTLEPLVASVAIEQLWPRRVDWFAGRRIGAVYCSACIPLCARLVPCFLTDHKYLIVSDLLCLTDHENNTVFA